ncbi:CoA-transferase subunit beta [Inmirania thermothiophila]|uniref:Glutaconate CoA-transferase subunit B n=1 Tax=Inmirania thermothiophila TaxID=1750597 RepID=A0A3N1Y0V7_9GAMM|nr:CoA-transferase [Inmirania thermothiophila]ROR32465.1 glutaconate CoA-transferase subunit B [Inmirania thermothiophila]
MAYSTQELMIIAAAREIADREVVFVGMRLPIMAFGVARATHAPDAVGLFECGLVRHTPASGMLYTMGDPPNQEGAAWATGTVQLLGLLQGGRVDVGFIGGAEVDRFGNVNTSYIGDPRRPKVKLPGSGGAADIAAMAHRLLVIINHERRRLVERVDYVTSVGHLDGGASRRRAGLRRGGTAAVITDKAILRPWGPERELHLASWHPGTTPDEVRDATGWDLRLHPEARPTPPPTEAELAALRRLDPEGFWR